MAGRWWALQVVLRVGAVAIMVGIWRHGAWSWAKSLIVGALILGVLLLLAVRSAKRIGAGQDRVTNWLSSRK
jgi:membrane protein implicated in regulation of membrane protease activity